MDWMCVRMCVCAYVCVCVALMSCRDQSWNSTSQGVDGWMDECNGKGTCYVAHFYTRTSSYPRVVVVVVVVVSLWMTINDGLT